MMMYYHGSVTTVTVVVMNMRVASPVIVLVVTIPVVVMFPSVVTVTVVVIAIIAPVVTMSSVTPVSSPFLRHCIH